MPPRNHCRFHPRPPVVSLGWLGKVIISLKLRLKAVGISPMAGGLWGFDIGRRGGGFFPPPESTRKENRRGKAQILYPPRVYGRRGGCGPAATAFQRPFLYCFGVR